MKPLYILASLLVLALCSNDSPSSPPGTVEPHWQKSSDNPVLRKGDYPTFDFIAVSDCWVMYHEGLYRMWYMGKDVEPLPEWPAPYYWELGYAQRETGTDSLYE